MSRRDALSREAATRAQRTKTYVCVCHGCGAFHEVKAEFLSAPQGIAFATGDNREWRLPTIGCPDCMAVPRDPGNPDEHPIRRAFLKGMTPAARERANREFAETWRAKLEERAQARGGM